MAKSIKTQDPRPKTQDQIRSSHDESSPLSRGQARPCEGRGTRDEGRNHIPPPSSIIRRPFIVWLSILGWLAMLIFAFYACTHMVAAGDTWVAMACGRHFVNHGVNTVEPFSANSHKAGPTAEEVETWPGWAQWITNKVGIDTVKKWHPTGWVNQNWLAHVMFYWLTTRLGSEDKPYFNALVWWKFAIYILAVVCVYYTGRLLGVHFALSAAFACFAMLIGRSFLDVRPAGFSNLLVAVFMLILVLTSYRNILYIWLIVPITVFWCNVHGGYIYVFIMLVPFIGLHLLTSCSKKWTAILYNATAWPFYIFVISKAGVTLSTFLFLILLIVLDVTLIVQKNRLVSIGFKGVYHTIAAGVVSFVAMVLLNPFHLTNLTHTFEISVSEHAARWRDVHEWGPAFDWKNPVGTAVPFLVMYIMAWFAVMVWLAGRLTVTRRLYELKSKRRAEIATVFEIPRIDLSLFVIVALTVYMAIRSRRFIPIAAVAACPLMAFVIQDLVYSIIAAISIRRYGTVTSSLGEDAYEVLMIGIAETLIIFGLWQSLLGQWLFFPIPNVSEYRLQPRVELFVLGVLLASGALLLSIVFYPIDRNGRKIQVQDVRRRNIFTSMTWAARLTIFASVVGLGLWVGLKFKHVYIDPWPNDPNLASVFMRITASDAKPWYAGEFIRMNKLKGNMFNYWTEGGFIAWAQQPDPNTGRTPLQLFMDGRAQAAYNRVVFDDWTYIMSGGPLGSVGQQKFQAASVRAQMTGKEVQDILTSSDYIKMGQSTDLELKKRNIWIALMPALQFDSIFVKSLEYHPDWRLVFLNNKQRIFIDCSSPQGSELFNEVITGQTLYPDEFCKYLASAHVLLVYYGRDGAQRKQGFDNAVRAFNLNPSPAPILEIMVFAARYGDLLPDIISFCKNYVDTFEKNKQLYAGQNGYRLKLEAARLASAQLRIYAEEQKNPQLATFYAGKVSQYYNERESVTAEKQW